MNLPPKVNYFKPNTGVEELKKLLCNPKVMKVYRELFTLMKYLKYVRKLLMVSYKSKDLLFVRENLEMPTLYLLNKMILYLKEQGTIFNYRITV